MTTVGPEIRAQREKRGMALETLALRACVSVDVLRTYEGMERITGADIGRLPSEAELERVASVLGTTMKRLARAALKRSGAKVVTSGGVMTIQEYKSNGAMPVEEVQSIFREIRERVRDDT
jgi:hypothetical protein